MKQKIRAGHPFSRYPTREPGGDAETVRERSSGQLDQIRMTLVGRHDQRRAIGAVGLEVVPIQMAGFGERRPESDRVVARRRR